MASVHSERETTFEGTGLFDLQDLRRLPAGDHVREEAPEELDATYYDTPDLRLLTHGVTLRRRSGGHDAGWHVKLPGVGPGRVEVRAPLDAGIAGEIPGELLHRTAAYAWGRRLVPVAHLRTRRGRHLLLDARERCLAEVAQDEVAAQTLDPRRPEAVRTGSPGPRPLGGKHDSAGTGTRITQWSEIEVELADGDTGLLEAAARWLNAAGWHRSRIPRKLDRALADELSAVCSDPARPGSRLRAGSAGEAVVRRLGEQLTVLLGADPGTRADETDALHRMRSAARRLRNVLRGHHRLLDRSRTDPAARELGWLTGILAEARDHEVLARRLSEQAERLRRQDPDLAVRSALQGLAGRVRDQERARHDAAWRIVVDTLDGARYIALLDDLDSLLTDPPLRRRARKPAVGQLRKVAARDRRRLAGRLAAVERAGESSARDQALHGARKAARRMRHTAETALPYCGKGARRLCKDTKALQQVLGGHQDAADARRALVSLAAEAHYAGTDTFGYGLLHAAQAESKAAAVRRLSRLGNRAIDPNLARLT